MVVADGQSIRLRTHARSTLVELCWSVFDHCTISTILSLALHHATSDVPPSEGARLKGCCGPGFLRGGLCTYDAWYSSLLCWRLCREGR